MQKAVETLNVVHEISQILDTGLDKETLAILIGLCEAGAHPEALAKVVQELKKEANSLKQQL
jgi:mitotic-spindle organizing protein 1